MEQPLGTPCGIRTPNISFRSARFLPRAPRCGLPPLSAPPCPSRLLHPARCAQGLLLGVEMWQLNVLLLHPDVAASLPRTSRKKRMSGGAASAGGSRSACAPPLGVRDLAVRARTSSVAFCNLQGSMMPLAMHLASASTAARTGAEGALSPPHMLPCLGPLFALVRRSAHQTANGSRRHGCPRGTAMSLDPCLQCTVASASRERSSAIEKGLAT